MIFTIGITENYNEYLLANPGLKKAIGGSVWRTFADAQTFCPPKYSVYGILADWEKDTTPNPEGGDWHDLLVEAKIIKLDSQSIRSAIKKARKIMKMVQGTMALEAQALDKETYREMKKETIRDILKGVDRLGHAQ